MATEAHKTEGQPEVENYCEEKQELDNISSSNTVSNNNCVGSDNSVEEESTEQSTTKTKVPRYRKLQKTRERQVSSTEADCHSSSGHAVAADYAPGVRRSMSDGICNNEVNPEERAGDDLPAPTPRRSIAIDFDRNGPVDVSVIGDDIPPPIQDIGSLELQPSVLDNLTECGYQCLTPAQEHALPVLLEGRDLVCSGQMGTGKLTGALLATVHHLLASSGDQDQDEPAEDAEPSADGPGGQECYLRPRCLVLTPTRDVATQILTEVTRLTKNTGLVAQLGSGEPHQPDDSEDQNEKEQEEDQPVDILVITPAKLTDMLNDSTPRNAGSSGSAQKVKLNRLAHVIMDDARRMLMMGFISDLRHLFGHPDLADQKRPVVAMLTNSLTQQVCNVADELLDPTYVQVEMELVASVCSPMPQRLLPVNNENKLDTLVSQITENKEANVVIFTKRIKKLKQDLEDRGLRSFIANAGRSQAASGPAHGGSGGAESNIVLLTHLAVKGVYLQQAGTVIQYDLPTDLDEHVDLMSRVMAATGASMGDVSLPEIISLVDPEMDAKMCGPLVKLLGDCDQQVPDWLLQARKQAAAGQAKGQSSNASRQGKAKPPKKEVPARSKDGRGDDPNATDEGSVGTKRRRKPKKNAGDKARSPADEEEGSKLGAVSLTVTPAEGQEQPDDEGMAEEPGSLQGPGVAYSRQASNSSTETKDTSTEAKPKRKKRKKRGVANGGENQGEVTGRHPNDDKRDVGASRSQSARARSEHGNQQRQGQGDRGRQRRSGRPGSERGLGDHPGSRAAGRDAGYGRGGGRDPGYGGRGKRPFRGRGGGQYQRQQDPGSRHQPVLFDDDSPQDGDQYAGGDGYRQQGFNSNRHQQDFKGQEAGGRGASFNSRHGKQRGGGGGGGGGGASSLSQEARRLLEAAGSSMGPPPRPFGGQRRMSGQQPYGGSGGPHPDYQVSDGNAGGGSYREDAGFAGSGRRAPPRDSESEDQGPPSRGNRRQHYGRRDSDSRPEGERYMEDAGGHQQRFSGGGGQARDRRGGGEQASGGRRASGQMNNRPGGMRTDEARPAAGGHLNNNRREVKAGGQPHLYSSKSLDYDGEFPQDEGKNQHRNLQRQSSCNTSRLSAPVADIVSILHQQQEVGASGSGRYTAPHQSGPRAGQDGGHQGFGRRNDGPKMPYRSTEDRYRGKSYNYPGGRAHSPVVSENVADLASILELKARLAQERQEEMYTKSANRRKEREDLSNISNWPSLGETVR